jgi:hypothetical protein
LGNKARCFFAIHDEHYDFQSPIDSPMSILQSAIGGWPADPGCSFSQGTTPA